MFVCIHTWVTPLSEVDDGHGRPWGDGGRWDMSPHFLKDLEQSIILILSPTLFKCFLLDGY